MPACQLWRVLMSRVLRILKRQLFAVFLPRGASEPIIRKLNQAAFATADTTSVQGYLNVLAAPIHRGADFGG
jgi:hypothetical protein